MPRTSTLKGKNATINLATGAGELSRALVRIYKNVSIIKVADTNSIDDIETSSISIYKE